MIAQAHPRFRRGLGRRIVSLILYPFVYVAIKADDGGPVFIIQERVGKDGRIIRIPKFRSMKSSDRGVWVKEHDDRITRVGKFIRKTASTNCRSFSRS